MRDNGFSVVNFIIVNCANPYEISHAVTSYLALSWLPNEKLQHNLVIKDYYLLHDQKLKSLGVHYNIVQPVCPSVVFYVNLLHIEVIFQLITSNISLCTKYMCMLVQ